MSGPLLSRPLSVASIPPDGVTVEIVADAAERESIAARNEVQSVESLVARLEARPFGRDGVAVTGRLDAETTRLCVATLEPFVEGVREEIDVRFSPSPDGAAGHDPDADDPPDPLVGGSLDLGAVVEEFFTLGLDPYPRKPGASFVQPGAGDDADSPFAALRGVAAAIKGERE